MRIVSKLFATLIATTIFCGIAWSGEEVEMTWTNVQDQYIPITNKLTVSGNVQTPVQGADTDETPWAMTVYPLTSNQATNNGYTASGGGFVGFVEDPLSGNSLPAEYVFIVFDSLSNYDGWGGYAGD